MKKEIDTYKLESLFDAFTTAMLWAWYLSSGILAATLWFYPLPNTNIQTFAFAGVFAFYSIVSAGIKKVAQIKQELK